MVKAVADHSDCVLDNFASHVKDYHYWVNGGLHRTNYCEISYPLSTSSGTLSLFDKAPNEQDSEKDWNRLIACAKRGEHESIPESHYLRIGRDCSLQLFETQVVAI